MALTPITPTRKIVKPASKGRAGGGGLGGLIGGIGGGTLGGLGAATVAAGAAAAGPVAIGAGILAGAGGGQALGSLAGGAVDPGKAPQAAQEQFSPQVPLQASDEAARGQQMLAAIKIANDNPGFGEYAQPLTKAYIQSMTNLKQMG